MITYDWNCKTVDVYPSKEDLTNVVYNVHWILTGVDENGNTGSSIGTQILSTENIETFIDVKDLTNEIITDWVKAAMGEETVQKLEENIDKQIDSKINPTSLTIKIGQDEEIAEEPIEETIEEPLDSEI